METIGRILKIARRWFRAVGLKVSDSAGMALLAMLSLLCHRAHNLKNLNLCLVSILVIVAFGR